jgi:magnesium-transporting ATPase (P-type)
MGREGSQAATMSDYSIANFKSLKRLLFWHGRKFGT